MAMEYDVTLLDLEGRPLQFVALDALSHRSLIEEATKLGLRRILQIGDFHDDGSIHADEVGEFMAELGLIQSPDIRNILDDLKEIAIRAKELHRGLLGIAD